MSKEGKSEAQLLTEFVCQRMALIKGKVLPDKFWNYSDWKKTYQLQIIQANALLKLYDYKAIMLALKSWRGKKTYSLRSPYLLEIIKEEQQKIDRVKTISEKSEKIEIHEDIVVRKDKKKNKLEGL
jgi:hypothetical protein